VSIHSDVFYDASQSGRTLILTSGSPKPTHNNTEYFSINASLAYILTPNHHPLTHAPNIGQYNTILISAPWPATLQQNQYFTVNFYQHIQQLLAPNGQLFIQTPPSNTNKKVVIHTLREVFKYVELQKCGLIQCQQPTNNLTKNNLTNTTHNPILLKNQLTPATNKTTTLFYLLTLTGVLMIVFFKTSAREQIIFISGFSISSAQVLFWTIMQLLSGFAYNYTGLAIVICMASLSAGAFISSQITHIRLLSKTRFCIYSIIIGTSSASIFLYLLQPTNSPINGLWVLVPVALVGLAAGALFDTLSANQKSNNRLIAGNLYSVDLVGGAIGAFTTTIIGIPYMGLSHTAIAISMIGVLALTITPKLKASL
jgi:predicted membrane-bound spermidine synthase